MATSAERKALIFLAAVVCLGAGARIARSRGDAALAAAGGRGRGDGPDALDAQISAVDAARAGLPGPAGARSTRKAKPSPRTRRRTAADSAPPDSLAGDPTRPAAPRPRARASRSVASPPPDDSAGDGWARRPVETILAPGGLGVVRGGVRPPEPDTAPSPRPRRRRRPKRP